MSELPTGTVTFLITDLVSSTRLWEEQPDAAMSDALARHDAILRAAIEGHHGTVFSTMGDGFAAVFASAEHALAAALEVQQRLSDDDIGGGLLRARVALHSDEGRLRAPGEYVNRPINRCARLMGVAHGGQVLVSNTTAVVGRERLPPDASLLDLGEHRLRDLAEPMRVFQLVHPALPETFPPLRSLDAFPGNLPSQVSSFIGRERELARVAAALSDSRVVTLTGVGGVGKTRLALEVAAMVADDFSDGAWLCELAPVADPDAVWEACAASFQVIPNPARPLEDTVLEHLASKRALVVLDNCEHLLEAVGRAVSKIGRRCSGVAVLATSREGLAIPGEQIVAVPSLEVPTTGADADVITTAASVRLFFDRARSVKHDFVANAHTLESVGQLCRRLDGIPLAIELAAARVASIGPEDLVSRLDQRFRLLTRGSRASLERHQTLRYTIDWSYDLLDEHAQAAFERLSVFAGGADLAAVEAVLSGGDLDAEDIVDEVGRLVDKSLVVADPDEDGRLRYRMLETIRQYAQERLETRGDVARVRSAHADHYAKLAETAGPHLRSRDLHEWAPRVAREIDNFRIAVDWAVETAAPDLAFRIIVPLIGHSHALGYSVAEWADNAIEIPGAEDAPGFLAVASSATFGATMRQDFPRATTIAERIKQIHDDRGHHDPAAYQGPATLAFFQGDLPKARKLAEQWVRLARATEDDYELAYALILHHATQSDAPFVFFSGEDRAEIEEAVRVARNSGNLSALSIALAVLVGTLDDQDEMLALSEEAISVARELNDHIASTVAASFQVWLFTSRGEHDHALQLACRTSDDMRRTHNFAALPPVLSAAATSLTRVGEPRTAAVLLGWARIFGAYGPAQGGGWIQPLIEDTDTVLRTELSAADFEALTAQGAAMSASEAIDYFTASRACTDDTTH